MNEAKESFYRPKGGLSNDSMSPLFEAVIEGTKEAITIQCSGRTM